MSITMRELKAKCDRLNAREELVLDVRSVEEFREGHVPGARNIPYEQVPDHAPELGRFSKIYLYCRSGGRVSWACHALDTLGVHNWVGVEEGGMPDWVEAGFPVEVNG